jgi:hypothetical protein
MRDALLMDEAAEALARHAVALGDAREALAVAKVADRRLDVRRALHRLGRSPLVLAGPRVPTGFRAAQAKCAAGRDAPLVFPSIVAFARHGANSRSLRRAELAPARRQDDGLGERLLSS